ncbi:hypothetical protein STP4a_094 [Salmonella phage STP4-a]|uniref:Uncharacterized protein n=1 Tax=Salmonella phage STP4-a TaxID=1445860 RepID=A0A0B4L992_9CAUD|nr:hypothetical protein STP4a_094 [Salmonella phage STP4-a]AHJ86949.1 hypothetical protein STP4a_094 [Salmonella phage STP4-a]UFK27219.1 hypothetical protein LG358_00198 [Escherichia phage UoN_LG358_1]
MSKISFKKPKTVIEPELVPIETGDILNILIDPSGTKKYEIRIVGKTCFGEFSDVNRQNYIFGTVVGDPDAIIQLDFKDEILYYNGSDFFKVEHFSVVEYKGEELVFDPKKYTLCKVVNKKKFINRPVAVGDMLSKPSSSGYWKVVYINDSCSAVVVENENTRKIEMINFKDTNALDAYGLFWG